MKKNYNYEPVTEETVEVFEEAVFIPADKIEAEAVEATNCEPEIMTAVVLRRCPVVSYNPSSKIIVYNDNGKLVQTNAIKYDGSGYVEVE